MVFKEAVIQFIRSINCNISLFNNISFMLFISTLSKTCLLIFQTNTSLHSSCFIMVFPLCDSIILTQSIISFPALESFGIHSQYSQQIFLPYQKDTPTKRMLQYTKIDQSFLYIKNFLKNFTRYYLLYLVLQKKNCSNHIRKTRENKIFIIG